MIRRWLLRLVDARVRELEADLAEARAEVAALRGDVERARADLEAWVLADTARLGAAHGCWSGRSIEHA